MDYLVIRMLSSLLVGVILSMTGSFIQLGTRNILASPSTLGFDGMSVLWMLIFHSLIISFGIEAAPVWMLVLSGLPAFFLIGILFSKMITSQKKFERIIILGLTFNLLVGAIFSLWQFFFLAFNLPFPVELWFGHFRFASLETLFILIVCFAGMLIGLRKIWADVVLYSLGRDISRNYELNEKRLFGFLFSSVAIATFIVVGLFGAFSFLGLIFPILSRRIFFAKHDLKGELFIGAFVNGLILMLIDLLCYELPIYGAEVPVGLIATVVGAVCLILILWNSSQELLAKLGK